MAPESTAAGSEVRALRQELEALRRELRPVHRLALEGLPPAAFLGQRVGLAVRVFDPEGHPLPGVPITLVTSWGTLRPESDPGRPPSPSTELRTGIDGAARAFLEPPLAEALPAAPQKALRAALEELDLEAATPEAALDGLRAMVRLYRWESNLPLRQAVDLLFRELRRAPDEAANPGAALARWRGVQVAVTAFSRRAEDAGGGPVAATAVAAVEVRDWLGAFLAAFRRAVEEEDDLATRFEGVMNREQPTAGGALLEGAAAAVEQFVGRQQGALGEEVGRRVAEAGIRRFLDERTAELPLDTRIRLGDGLQGASRLLGAAGTAALATLSETRRETRQEVQGALGDVRGQIDGVRTGLGEVRGEVAGFQAGLGDVRGEIDGVRTGLGAVRGQIDGFRADLGQVRGDVGGLRADLGGVRADLDDVRGGLGDLRGELGDVRGGLGDVQAGLDDVRGGLGDVRGGLDDLRGSVLDRGTFDDFRGRVERDLARTQTDLRRELTQGLAGKADVTAIQRVESVVNRNFRELQRVVGGFQVLPFDPSDLRPIDPGTVIGPGSVVGPGPVFGPAGPSALPSDRGEDGEDEEEG